MALFTAENAAEMGKRGNAAFAIVRERRKVLSADPDKQSADAEDFRRLRLSRVRRQLDLIDGLIFSEMAKDSPDPAKLDRLASAAIRLNEQERQLSNRSLPPTLKANQVRPRKSQSAGDPEDA